MTDLTYHVVDVFTERAFAGNPLAVVLDAIDLPDASLLAIAKEFNLSETAFPGDVTADSYRLRIFTPGGEIPFAGHPTVGTAWLLHSLGLVSAGPVTQHVAAGAIALDVSQARVSVVAPLARAEPPRDAGALLAAAGLAASDAGTSPPRRCPGGLDHLFVEVASAGAVSRMAVDPNALAAAAPDAQTVSFFAWDTATATAYTRVFAGGVGIAAEDPATGSAAAAFGAWLAASGYVAGDGETAYVVVQGVDMGRPSRIDGAVVTRGGAAVECRISGSAVAVATGVLRAP